MGKRNMVKLERIFTLSEAAQRCLASSMASMSRAADFSVAKPRWHSAIVCDLSIARDLLDQLENAGWAASELRILGGARFEVRWREAFSALPVGN